MVFARFYRRSHRLTFSHSFSPKYIKLFALSVDTLSLLFYLIVSLQVSFKMSNFRRPFTDAKQQDYAQCAIDLDVKLSHNYIEYTYYDETVWPMIIALCSDSDAGVIRYCQAMITEMGRVNRQKMDVIASFMVWYYEKIKKSSKNYPIAIPPIEDIASLINLYLSQICPWDFDHRIANICLLMMKMGDWYPEEQLVVLFSDQVMTFFIGCLYNNPDKWTQLYTLFNLMFSSNFECIKKIIFDNCTLRLAVKQNSAYLCQFKPISLYRARDDNFLLFQIGSCAQWLMKNVFDADKIIDDDDIPLREENDVQPWDTDVVVVDYPVESEDQSKDKDSKSDESDEQLESDESDKQSSDEDSRSEVRTSTTMKHLHRVTTDNLSVIGCHFAWQDYQFTKPVDITSGQVFYYEVILLTTGTKTRSKNYCLHISFCLGSIRIGWATKLNDFGFYGFSSDPDSISFDAFEKQICAQRESQFFRKLPPVSACDVVGCLLDTSLAGTVYFQFYLNGKEVGPHRWEGRRLSLSKGFVTYYPTVSLSGCQQVYFNFGQMPYRYSPLLPVHYFTSLIKPLAPVFDISSRMFVDDTQKKFEQWMLHFDWSIAEGASDDELSELGSKLLKVAQFQWNSELRLMQAMIEQMGIIDESKVSHWTLY